jgi:hypothetical protein
LLSNFLFPLLCFWRIVFPLQETSCCVFRMMVRLWTWSACQETGVMGEHEVSLERWLDNEHERSLEWWWWWESVRRWSALHNNGKNLRQGDGNMVVTCCQHRFLNAIKLKLESKCGEDIWNLSFENLWVFFWKIKEYCDWILPFYFYCSHFDKIAKTNLRVDLSKDFLVEVACR